MRNLGAIVTLLLVSLGAEGIVHAQAWTPASRSLGVDAAYSLGYGTRSEEVEANVTHHIITPELEYGITDSLAVSASLPIVAVKSETMFEHGSWDDGSTYASLN